MHPGETMSSHVGVSRQTVITMETGDYAPSVYLALRVARTLGTTVEALWGQETTLGGADPRNTP